MPEGDTVWLAGQRLHAALAGRVLTRTDFRVPALATTDLAGTRVHEVLPRGKHLLFRFREGPGDGLTLHTHFKMDGSWHLYAAGEPRRGGPDWQVRAVLEIDDRVAVGYRLPVVELVPTADEAGVVGHLGHDLLDPDLDLAAAAAALAREGPRQVGDALLDQRVVAGVGNLYRAETCFLARVTPFTPVDDLAEFGSSPQAVVAVARKLLLTNADRSVQSTTGLLRRDSWHWVYERRTCLRCGTRVSTAFTGVAPRQRVAYWCPRCQAGPAPASVPVRELLPPTTGRTRYKP